MSAGGPAATAATTGTPAPAAEAPKPAAPEQSREGQAAKPLKPIPPKSASQGLPGVWKQRGDPEDAAIAKMLDPTGEEAAKKEAKAKAPEASDAGTDKTAAQTKDEGEAQPAARPKPAETPAPESEAFTDEHRAALEAEESDPAKVLHALKTLKGMHQAVLKEKAATKEVRTKAIDLANQWKAEAERVTAELEQVRKGSTAPAANQPTPTATADSKAQAKDPAARLLEAIPVETFDAIVEKYGSGVGLQWALDKAHKLMSESFKEMLDQRLAPVEQTAAVSAQVKKVVDTFKGVAEIRDPTTQDYFYPELHDPALLDRVIYVWKEMGLPEHIAYSQKGVHLAVITVRDALSRIGGAAAVSPTANAKANPAPAPNAEVEKVADALAASLNRQNPGVITGAGAQLSRPGNGHATEADLIRKGILDASPTNAFGVARR